MKITLRINASETVCFQKNDIIYMNETVDQINLGNRIISLLSIHGIWFYFGIKEDDLKNAFTYLMYDREYYVLHPDWLRIVDNDKRLIKFITN